MSVATSVADILDAHVTLELESIDRMYLNVYVPRLQHELGLVGFFRDHRGFPFVSSVLMADMTRSFVGTIKDFIAREGVPLVHFEKGQRKDDVAREYLDRFEGQEGVLFVGRAQEKMPVFRTEKRRNPLTGRSYPWIVRSTAMVNVFYFYGLDRDFGPFFVKFSTYFPYTAKVCLNGHEYLKRQLTRRGVGFEPLDNGIASCADPRRAQAIARGLSPARIEAFVRKWLRLLPDPYSRDDRRAGYRYDISVLQAEFSLTQVLDRPLQGRVFFEQVIRDNLDVGRPDQVALIFNRRISKRTPGRFRTRIITQGVTPSLYVDYKRCRIKQYHKEGRALRTETTVNDTRDFAIGRRLHNLPALREVGFRANRRLLHVQRASHDPAVGEDAFRRVNSPAVVSGQRASALRFADARVQALLGALVVFRLLPHGFSNRDLRAHLAPLLGLDPGAMTQGRMSYDLRRLRLHGLITRLTGTHRYEVTDFGLRTALFFTRAYNRLLRPGLSELMTPDPPSRSRLRPHFDRLHAAMDHWVNEVRLAA